MTPEELDNKEFYFFVKDLTVGHIEDFFYIIAKWAEKNNVVFDLNANEIIEASNDKRPLAIKYTLKKEEAEVGAKVLFGASFKFDYYDIGERLANEATNFLKDREN